MKHYQLGSGSRSVEFIGELLASRDSRAPRKRRWSEVSLFQTEDGSFVAAGCGYSTVPGEYTRCWAERCEDILSAEQCFTLKHREEPYLPLASRLVLEQAVKMLGEREQAVRPT